MDPALAAALVVLLLLCVAAYLVGLSMSKRGEPFRDWVTTTTRHRHSGREPASRPIQAITADLRRLGARFHALDAHASHTKVEAVRGAYDRALAECCDALGHTQLLGVLPDGPELDAERQRVEERLTHSGVRLPHAA
jgi:hypothetical protein